MFIGNFSSNPAVRQTDRQINRPRQNVTSLMEVIKSLRRWATV